MNASISSTPAAGFDQLASGLNKAIHDFESASGSGDRLTFRSQTLPWARTAAAFAEKYRVPLALAGIGLVMMSIRRSQRMLRG